MEDFDAYFLGSVTDRAVVVLRYANGYGEVKQIPRLVSYDLTGGFLTRRYYDRRR
jgi:hypothetical protein